MQEDKTFTYYAFISYSHKDDKWAKWLQRKLESYRLPTVIRKESGKPLPKRIAPVFLDASDLSVGKLNDNLRKELEESRYLIVICSPNSAKPNDQGFHYVNNEVTDFCKLGREDQIIPVIVDGIPGDPNCNCFCPKITELGLVGLDATKHPKARILSDVVAKILSLRPDELWQREKRRIRKNNIIRASLAFLLLTILALAGIWVYWYYIPYERYYEDIVLKDLEPYGINQIKKENVRRRPYSWRLTYHKGHLKKAQHVNSRNYVRNSSSLGLAEIEVAGRFATNGFVQRLNFRNLYGKLLGHADIILLPTGSLKIDYKDPWGNLMQLDDQIWLSYMPTTTAFVPFIPQSGFSGNTLPLEKKVNKPGRHPTGFEVKLDEQGYITNLLFIDRNGKSCPHNLCEEITVIRHPNQIIARMTLADGFGKGKQVSATKNYKNGRFVSGESGAWGIFLPDNFIPSKWNKKAHSAIADMLSNNFVRLEIDYDDYGNITCFTMKNGTLDDKLSPKYLVDNHFYLCEIVGNVISGGKDAGKAILKLNSHGDLTTGKSSVAGSTSAFSCKIEYFPDGFPRTILLDNECEKDGESGMYMKEPFMEMDRAGNCILRGSSDASDGKKEVYVKVEFNRDNLPVKYSAYGDRQLHNKIMIPSPVRILQGYKFHSEEIEYHFNGSRKSSIGRDTHGNIIYKVEHSYTVVDGVDISERDHFETPVRNYYLHVKYDKYHRETSVAYSLDEEGKKLFISEKGFAKMAVEYDGTSSGIKRQVTYGEDGNMISWPQTGFAVEEREYDAYGNLTMRSFRDPNGKPCTMKPLDVYAVKFENQQRYGGKLIRVIYLEADKKTPMKANGDGSFGRRFEYETVNRLERLKCVIYCSSKEHIRNDVFAPRENMLYNAQGQAYGKLVLISPVMQPQRVKNYVRVSQVFPGSLAEKHGILVNDIIIASPGFDERKDCNLSFGEKCALLKKSVKEKREIFTARFDLFGRGVTIHKHEIPPGMSGISFEEVQLSDLDFYNKIAVKE